MNSQTKTLTALLLILAVAPFVAADSYQLWCVYDGDSINFGQLCIPGAPIITAPPNGYTAVCVHLLNNGKICHTSPNICNSLGLSCSPASNGSGQNHTIDIIPPNITIAAPMIGSNHTDRNVLLSLTANEQVDLHYEKTSKPGKWNKLCIGCSSFNQERSFDEGSNEIRIRAVDRAGNEAYRTLSFKVDSKTPKITSLYPNEGFVSGNFEIDFTEENPQSLVLHYGNTQTGFRTKTVNLADCMKSGANAHCTTSVNLADYNGEQIDAYASLTDVAGNTVQSKKSLLDIDNSAPIISSSNYQVNAKKVSFTFEIDEPYFEKVVYIDDSESSPKEKTLCSKLVNNICEKQVSFNTDGNHQVRVIVKDLAGNQAVKNFNFFTDSKKPKINYALPEKGFASGLFEVEFQEENPTELTLEYGNSALGFITAEISLEDDCTSANGKYFCSTQVDLSDYEGYEIDYEFVLTDKADQTVSASSSFLLVDITFPEFESLTYETLSSKKINVILEAREPNVASILYINMDESKPREKKLCSGLSAQGICEKKISINSGMNRIDVIVTDKAGNSAVQRLVIDN